MRMRRKKGLDSRLEACGGLLLPLVPAQLNSSMADETAELLDYRELFGDERPVELEIGCGKGRFICTMARTHPDRGYIAVEMSRNVVVTACEQAREQRVGNVRFIALPAEYLLRYLPPHSIERVYLNFSCPYPKKTWANRRLTNPKLLAIYSRLLKPDGAIFQKTDNARFFEYSIETLSAAGFALRNVSLDLHAAPVEGDVMTEYKQHFVEEGKPIYRLEAHMRGETRAERQYHESKGNGE